MYFTLTGQTVFFGGNNARQRQVKPKQVYSKNSSSRLQSFILKGILSNYNFIFVQKRRKKLPCVIRAKERKHVKERQGNMTQQVSPEETAVVRLFSSYFVKVKSK